MKAFALLALRVSIALLAMLGLFRRWVDPIILVINLGSLAGVWRSILDRRRD